jgi:tetratricopeptide (TPR) repeat protein
MRNLHGLPGGLGCRWSDVAERSRERVLLRPDDWVSWNNGSSALWLLDEPIEAEQWARRAVALKPDQPLPWRSWGNALTDLGRFSRAARAFAASLKLLDCADTAYNASKVLFALGRYPQALHLAERRLETAQCHLYRAGPFWQGWPDPEAVVLWSEQGFGDVIQALRWLIPLRQRWKGPLWLEVEASMVPLLQQGLAWLQPALQVRGKQNNGVAGDYAGCHGSLLSLGAWLGVDLVPEAWASGPYLRLPGCSPSKTGRRPRVGLVWASGRFLDGHVQEREYGKKSLLGSALPALLQGLADRPIELVNLQFGPDRQAADAQTHCFSEALPADADFLASAQTMQGLDLVISVDTAAAHLAGALGRPVWVLLPWAAEARWGRGTITTPWYPTATLLRQPHPRDWFGLIRLLLARMDLWLSSW